MQQPQSYYAAVVPDTLDLAERARLGVNALVGIVNRAGCFQPYQCGRFYRNPQVLSTEPGGYIFQTGNEMWGKHVEALLEMRLMSGSQQESDMDDRTTQGMVSCIEEDGLFYSYVKKVDGDRLVEMEDFCDLVGGARVMLGLIAKYQLDGNPEWKTHLARLARGLIDVAITKEDYAYFPDGHMGGAISRPRSGWKTSDEPAGESLHDSHSWYESASIVQFSFGGIVQALSRWYLMSGDKASLELAGKLARFMTRPKFWQPEAEPAAVVSGEHAHFEGHIHATVRGLWGLLEYAVIANDERLKAFVRDGYEYARTFGIARIGLFGEGCTIGDMTCLAIKLTDAGVGDYWEDVDQYVRNHLVEIQILDPEPIRQIAAASPAMPVRSWEDADRFVERNIGALCDDGLHPTVATPGAMLCCTYNGLIGYYHAWEAIVRDDDGAAQVNLLLNRASPWLDIDSYLPYAGKVVVKNKTAHKISLRIPRWVEKQAVRSAINGNKVKPYWLGQYMVFETVSPQDVITVEFPMVESSASYTVGWSGIRIPGWTEVTQPLDQELPASPSDYYVSANGEQKEPRPVFTLHFRGNDLVDIHPREEGLGYPLYRRERYQQGSAPTKTVQRFVAAQVVDI